MVAVHDRKLAASVSICRDGRNTMQIFGDLVLSRTPVDLNVQLV